MPGSLPIAVVGLGRMGRVHAQHVLELERETGACTLAALVDVDPARARNFAVAHATSAPILPSVEALAESGLCQATFIVTPTDQHRAHAARLIAAGHRVLLEKPLTGTLAEDRAFAAELDREHPQALMLAFQRRFDMPLSYAKHLLERGIIGRPFRIDSALEDSRPAPDAYQSGGILPDMAVHNVDEVLWLAGRMPESALAIGSRLFSHRLTTCQEDFDDAQLLLWFPNALVARIQVSRNHVSGYRVETTIFGEKGQIQVGRFDQKPREITVTAYGDRDLLAPVEQSVFSMPDYGAGHPEFVDRFGPAYKEELAVFIECCREGRPFPTTHQDGLRAQQVIDAGMQALISPDVHAARI